jgi:hypothetical protein
MSKSYDTESCELQEGKHIGHQENPSGQKRLPINHKVNQNCCLGFIAKFPVPRYRNAEESCDYVRPRFLAQIQLKLT